MRRLSSPLSLILALAVPALTLVGCDTNSRNAAAGDGAPHRDGDDDGDDGDGAEAFDGTFGARVAAELVVGPGGDTEEGATEESDIEDGDTEDSDIDDGDIDDADTAEAGADPGDSGAEDEEDADTEETADPTETADEEEAEDELADASPDGVLSDWSLYVEPESDATRQADAWRDSDPESAAHMDRMGDEPLALWVGDWMSDVSGSVDEAVTAGGDELRTLVVYNIPGRDCGAWSAGGAGDAAAYAVFIAEVARGLDNRSAIVVLEPDGLALTSCLSTSQIAERQAMMAGAVETLAAAGAEVYIDAGQAGWVDAAEMASHLSASGVANAAGFALNVAHTHSTADSVAYAEELRAILGPDAHYVVDTSRNGLGPNAEREWCNPLGRAVGESPTLSTGVTGLDALLWIKAPGESDGECNGGPAAGQWWADYALGLVERSTEE